MLRNLEISLRTNNIEWVREFLSEESQGLNILIEYLNSRLQLMRCKLAAEKEKNVDNGGFGRFLFINKCLYVNVNYALIGSIPFCSHAFKKPEILGDFVLLKLSMIL